MCALLARTAQYFPFRHGNCDSCAEILAKIEEDKS